MFDNIALLQIVFATLIHNFDAILIGRYQPIIGDVCGWIGLREYIRIRIALTEYTLQLKIIVQDLFGNSLYVLLPLFKI